MLYDPPRSASSSLPSLLKQLLLVSSLLSLLLFCVARLLRRKGAGKTRGPPPSLLLADVCVNCWFCGVDSAVAASKVSGWWCEHCEQYNGFDSSMPQGYSVFLPQLRDGRWNSEARLFRRLESVEEFDRDASYAPLCAQCEYNQLMIVRRMASFDIETDVALRRRLRERVGDCSNVPCRVSNHRIPATTKRRMRRATAFRRFSRFVWQILLPLLPPWNALPSPSPSPAEHAVRRVHTQGVSDDSTDYSSDGSDHNSVELEDDTDNENDDAFLIAARRFRAELEREYSLCQSCRAAVSSGVERIDREMKQRAMVRRIVESDKLRIVPGTNAPNVFWQALEATRCHTRCDAAGGRSQLANVAGVGIRRRSVVDRARCNEIAHCSDASEQWNVSSVAAFGWYALWGGAPLSPPVAAASLARICAFAVTQVIILWIFVLCAWNIDGGGGIADVLESCLFGAGDKSKTVSMCKTAQHVVAVWHGLGGRAVTTELLNVFAIQWRSVTLHWFVCSWIAFVDIALLRDIAVATWRCVLSAGSDRGSRGSRGRMTWNNASFASNVLNLRSVGIPRLLARAVLRLHTALSGLWSVFSWIALIVWLRQSTAITLSALNGGRARYGASLHGSGDAAASQILAAVQSIRVCLILVWILLHVLCHAWMWPRLCCRWCRHRRNILSENASQNSPGARSDSRALDMHRNDESLSAASQERVVQQSLRSLLNLSLDGGDDGNESENDGDNDDGREYGCATESQQRCERLRPVAMSLKPSGLREDILESLDFEGFVYSNEGLAGNVAFGTSQAPEARLSSLSDMIEDISLDDASYRRRNRKLYYSNGHDAPATDSRMDESQTSPWRLWCCRRSTGAVASGRLCCRKPIICGFHPQQPVSLLLWFFVLSATFLAHLLLPASDLLWYAYNACLCCMLALSLVSVAVLCCCYRHRCCRCCRCHSCSNQSAAEHSPPTTNCGTSLLATAVCTWLLWRSWWTYHVASKLQTDPQDSEAIQVEYQEFVDAAIELLDIGVSRAVFVIGRRWSEVGTVVVALLLSWTFSP